MGVGRFPPYFSIVLEQNHKFFQKIVDTVLKPVYNELIQKRGRPQELESRTLK